LKDTESRLMSILPAPIDGRDPLTGLPDRYAGRTCLEAEFIRCRSAHQSLAVLLLDIDRFKLINYGYSERHGDRVLKAIAQLAARFLRPGDQLIRWGGQEFLFLLPATARTDAAALAERLRAAIERLTVALDGAEMSVTASLGLACYPDNGDEPARLLAAAGAALHRAKSGGRNRVMAAADITPCLFGAGTLLTRALREGRIVPAFQPIVDLTSGDVVAEEALARMVSPMGQRRGPRAREGAGAVSPGTEPLAAEHFIRAAHELQLTHQIDRAIILSTFVRCAQSRTCGSSQLHFVNISGDLLRHPTVVAELIEAANRHCDACGSGRANPKPLVIEVTERELLEDTAAASELLKPFVDFGLQLALDDFGSGYSSHKYLADLPFSFLKIEGSLVRRIAEPRVRHIVHGMQRIAAGLGLTTIAEYVENEEIADIVRDLGINWAQGYYFGRPALPGSGQPQNP
jgi:diguanylate cyclase (GGDEF)-like protein